MKTFSHFSQNNAKDCGPTCLKMITKHYGRDISITKLREASKISRSGVSLLNIAETAENIGFKTLGAKITLDQLLSEVPLPAILHWRSNHFVVIPPQKKKTDGTSLLIADPSFGLCHVNKKDFLSSWATTGQKGICLLLEPTPAFFSKKDYRAKISWKELFYFLKINRKYLFQIYLGLLIGIALQLVFPYFTQSIVDVGINTQDLPFIYIVVIAQAILFVSRTIIDFIKGKMLLFISTNINIRLVTGFWYKLMKLPISYFETKMPGDIYQRLGDQNKIEQFLTANSISILFSFINLIIFSFVLLSYSKLVFVVYIISSVVYFIWVKLFLKFRREINYTQFRLSSSASNATIQMIHGMQEIKLANAEKFFRWKWEFFQAEVFRLKFKNLSINQLQQAGVLFINESKNIITTLIVAKLVIDGKLTLGAMIAIQYVLAQLNSPVDQFVGLAQTIQDAKISLERLNEIHDVKDEESNEDDLVKTIPTSKKIVINNVSYSYKGSEDIQVLKNINLVIPENKVTAIVGMSGSGKTTLLKLLLKFYDNYSGNIFIGSAIQYDNISRERSLCDIIPDDRITQSQLSLKKISPSVWRSKCGSVMQESYIFNDSIERNIAIGEENPNKEKILQACKVANIEGFVNSLPLGLNTMIGQEGNGISQGQKQRILIARVVYKNPDFILFDEATNSLDANNEKVIVENLKRFFGGKTVVIVAHRLSTVKNADNIVVLHEGSIIENGTHDDLIAKRGSYFELIKNQLELDR